MSEPVSYRPTPGTVPTAPGVYRFLDAHDRVLYVGKAKNLRARLNSYFADPAALHARTRQLVNQARDVRWTVVGTEVEALQLEYNWIKEFDPRFNVRFRDDKSYPSLAVTLDEEIPRVLVVRERRRRGVRYFGPYAHAWAIRETLDQLLRVFPVRTCSPGVYRRAAQIGRPCLFGYIDRCSAPCVGRVTPAEHRQIVTDLCDFLSGGSDQLIARLEREMHAAASREDFERAARARDDLGALRRVTEKQSVVLADGTDADVVGVVTDPLEAALVVFRVRGGRVRGQAGWVVDRVDEAGLGDLVEGLLTQLYGATVPLGITEGASAGPSLARPGPDTGGVAPAPVAGDRGFDVPPLVLVPELPVDATALAQWLGARRGSRVELRVPQRGDKRALLETVTANAGQQLTLHRLRRAADLTTRSLALQELQDALGLAEAPLRIECYDVSHVQGSDVVASMVVFEDGLARKSEYRRFAITSDGGGDTAWLAQVLTRRFARLRQEREELLTPGAPPRRFAYPPQLVVVDGGAPQVEAASAALAGAGVEGVALCGLAKRLEEVWLPGDPDPLVLARTSEALYLLQRLRDEAHRFAITYHRQRRSRSMLTSALDGVGGLGETRRAALLRRFGSMRRLRAAGVAELMEVPGIGRATAEAVVAALQADPAPLPAVNPSTGEIIDPAE